jgi:phage-related protein
MMPTAMIGQDLYYHGKSLLTDFSCIAEKWPDMEMGSPSYTEHVIIGVDGKIYQSDRRDTDTVLTFTCLFRVRSGYTYRDTYREIRDWIYSPGEEILKESRNSGHFWKVKKATVSTVKPTSNHAASFELTFVVEDHEYFEDGTEEIELDTSDPEDEVVILLEDSSGSFYLEDTAEYDQTLPMLSHPAWIIHNDYAECCPIWHLYGDWPFTISINDNIIGAGTIDTVNVDTGRMIAYTRENEAANNCIEGDYSGMRLKHGDNIIYIAGYSNIEDNEVINISYTPNWRRY